MLRPNASSCEGDDLTSRTPARKHSSWFNAAAVRSANAVGSPYAFGAAVFLVLGWAASGPVFGFSDTWQLVINTGTTIITFLMVFLIQHTQNRDIRAVHLKLDELISALREARNELLDAENMPDDSLDALQAEFQALCKKAQSAAARAAGGPRGSVSK